jgi:hypothetical protein
MVPGIGNCKKMIPLHLTTYLHPCKAAHFMVSRDIGESRKMELRLCLKKAFLAMRHTTRRFLKISKYMKFSSFNINAVSLA